MHARPLYDSSGINLFTYSTGLSRSPSYSTTSQRSNFMKGNNRTTTITPALETILQQAESLKGKKIRTYIVEE
jgi:hypothetical protein